MSDLLQDRDYTLIIDRSGSMAEKDGGNTSRWQLAREGAVALAAKCEEYDKDGITVYDFSNNFQRHENVTSERVSEVFKKDPQGSTALDLVLKHAFDDYFTRKAAGKTKANGDLIVVVTDGVPDDQKAVKRVIIEASKRMERDAELAVTFLQIGKDAQATKYLKTLDDDLESEGAKFDIVDTKTADEAANMPYADFLIAAITD
jgi:hypothetical protein